MKPSLLILAAGMGSRYGGVKQIEPVGAAGEIILEYSIHDAIKAGFGRVIFVIRPDIRQDFDEYVLPRFSDHIPCEYVFQDMEDIPGEFSVPSGRRKPWGTAHAVLAARKVISEPFAVINADDFYGQDAFRVMGQYLATLENDRHDYAMVGYQLMKTVSENGTVSRGICEVDSDGLLRGMVEHTKLEKAGDRVISHLSDGSSVQFNGDEPVSMNLFGFTPAILPEMEAMFADFLKSSGPDETSEFYIPTVANRVVDDGVSSMRVLRSSAEWFGITYKEDRPAVVSSIAGLIEQGVYPAKLWD